LVQNSTASTAILLDLSMPLVALISHNASHWGFAIGIWAKENARLKRLLAERMLENDLLKELLEKKG
jgi:hypothetical protein